MRFPTRFFHSKPPQRRKNLRILVVTPYFASHGGGIESVAWQLIRHLLDANPTLQIEWMASDCDAPPAPTERARFLGARAWNGIEKKSGLPVPLWSLGALARLWRAIGRCDAVHFHDVAYASSLWSALFCRWRGKPYFVTQHTGFVEHPNRVIKALRSWVNRNPGRWMLTRADAVVFISDAVRRAFAPLLPLQILKFVPNGVETAIFCAPDALTRQKIRIELERQLGFDPARPLILFVGRFVEMKGVLIAAQLSRRMPDCNWIFAGHGPLDVAAMLIQNGRVVQNRRGATLAELYQAADLLILPSYSEGFPLVVQEAIACGAPALVESAIGNAAPGAKAWLYLEELRRDETDLPRWEAAVRTIIARGPEPDPARENRASLAGAEWNWTRCARTYQALFESVTDLAPGERTH